MRIDTNNKMTMIRGETESFTVGGANEPFETGDSVHFTVAKSFSDNPVLHIEVTSFTEEGAAVINVAHSDTAGLDVGSYVYDVRVIKSNNVYKTILGGKKDTPAEFFLVPEVTK